MIGYDSETTSVHARKCNVLRNGRRSGTNNIAGPGRESDTRVAVLSESPELELSYFNAETVSPAVHQWMFALVKAMPSYMPNVLR